MVASQTRKNWKPKGPQYLEMEWSDRFPALVEEMVDLLVIEPRTLEELQDALGLIATEDERQTAKKSWQYIPGITYIISRARAKGYAIKVNMTTRLVHLNVQDMLDGLTDEG